MRPRVMIPGAGCEWRDAVGRDVCFIDFDGEQKSDRALPSDDLKAVHIYNQYAKELL